MGGMGVGTTISGFATGATGGATGAGGTFVTAAGGSFDVAAGGAFRDAGPSMPADELMPTEIDQVALTTPLCGANSLVTIVGADATGCSVSVPLLQQGCGDSAFANPALINVYFTQGEGGVFIVPRSTSSCAGHGWDTDAAGSILWFCPETCEALSHDPSAVVYMTFECIRRPCIV